MKTLKYLTICFVVCCLFSSNVFAQVSPCSTSLDDSLDPSGNIYQGDDLIQYVVSLAIANPTNCSITDIRVYFFAPDNPPNAANPCDATNGVEIFNGGSLVLEYGDPAIVLNSLDDAVLAYLVDETDADASGFLYAYICTKFNAITPLGKLAGSDNKPSINKVIEPEFMVDKTCVNPNGTLIGEDAEFKITITNTGDVPLDFLINDASAVPPLVDVGVGPIAPDANYVTTITIPTTGECADDLLVPNQVIVDGFISGETVAFDQKSDSANCPVICPPSFTVEKTCLTDPIIDEPNALFQIVITNTGYVPLEFEIDDLAAGIENLIVGPVAPDANHVMIVEVPAICANGGVDNRVVVQALFDAQPVLNPMPAEATCPCAGLEGCTPGFWKNHTECWGCYTTTTKLNQVFDFPGTPSKLVALGNTTLLDALSLPGGKSKIEKAEILMRHAVSAVLNACNGNVEYPDDVAGVVDAVNAILADWSNATGKDILSLKNQFQDWNELGCPINAKCEPKPVEVY